MAHGPDPTVHSWLDELDGLDAEGRALVRVLTENRRVGWRADLERDPNRAANEAKWALRAASSEPSYYDAVEGNHAAHVLAREQAAVRLAAWRLTRA